MKEFSRRSRSLSPRYVELIAVQTRNRRCFVIAWRRPALGPNTRLWFCFFGTRASRPHTNFAVQARNRRCFIAIAWRRPALGPNAPSWFCFSGRGRPVPILYVVGIAEAVTGS